MRVLNPYYTLAVHYDGFWCAEFGDPDLDIVQQERQDHRESSDLPASAYRILLTESSQAAIDAAIAKINRG